jgi:hypothetical protein
VAALPDAVDKEAQWEAHYDTMKCAVVCLRKAVAAWFGHGVSLLCLHASDSPLMRCFSPFNRVAAGL